MSSPKNRKNIIFPYSVLHIQLDTNTGKRGGSSVHLFKRTMIKMPKMDVVPIFTSEYPYFTKNIKYPKSLENADWRTKYEFFFNRQIFLDKLNKQIELDETNFIKPIKTRDPEAENEYYINVQDIEKENIMITLRCIFPIPEVFGKTLKNSYEHILTSNSNERVFKDINVLSTLNIFGFMYKFGIITKEKHEYFINIGGKRYMVDNVIWENDLINHPVYKKFLLAQRNVYEEVENNKFNIEQRKNATEEEFTTILDKKPDDSEESSKLELIQDKRRIINGFFKSVGTDSSKPIEIDESNPWDSIKKVIKQRIDEESQKKVLIYIINELNLIDKIFLYLNQDSEYDKENIHYKKLTEDIAKINKDIGELIQSKIKKEQDKMVDNYRKKKYKELFKFVLEFIKYFELHKNNLNYNQSKYDLFVTKYDASKTKAKAKSKSKSKSLFETNLIESFNKRTSNVSNKSSISTVQSFQLQQFQNAVSTIKKLLDELFSTEQIISPLKKAEKIISIQEEIEQYGKQSNTQQPEKVFFESSEIPFLQQLIKSAIQVKASNIVYDFVENNTPMNLSNTILDSKNEISSVMKRVNDYITQNYATEVRINNKLSSNTSNIYEPVRKTSNRELYEVIRLFKVGEKILRAKNKSLTDEQVERYKKVINAIYDEYILEIKSEDNDIYNKYLYVGTDDVNINEKQEAAANPNEATTEVDIKRNVKEIYVQFDLVDADTFEKTDRASCKLYDKDLSEEFLYLADPRNKNNRSLSRFRNLDFNSVIPDPLSEAVDPNNPTAAINQSPYTEKGGYTRRARSGNGFRTLRSYK